MVRRLVLLALGLLIVAAGDAAAGGFREPPDFSGVMVVEGEGLTGRGRIYYTKDMQRMEVSDPGSGASSVIISRADKGVVWVLMPSQRAYMEMPSGGEKANPLTGTEEIIKRERAGVETVGGRPCDKEKVTATLRDGRRATAWFWTAKDLGWPIKAEALDGSWSYTLEDIQVGRQDASLFEVPKGYTTFPMPGAGGLFDDLPGGESPEYPGGQEYPDPADPADFPEPYFPEPEEPATW